MEESAALWWQKNTGNARFAGDNEQYNNCTSGYYRQVANHGINGSHTCDGQLTHPANDDVNPNFPVHVFGSSVTCDNCLCNILPLCWG